VAGAVEVDLEVMGAVQAQLGKTADDLSEQIGSLKRRMTELLEHWRGHTADRYREDWHEWYEAARTVIDSLQDSADLLGANHRAYATTEDANAAALHRVGSTLNLDVT